MVVLDFCNRGSVELNPQPREPPRKSVLGQLWLAGSASLSHTFPNNVLPRTPSFHTERVPSHAR